MSAENEGLPEAGYQLAALYCLEASYQAGLGQEELEGLEPSSRDIEITWDWKAVGENVFEILFGASIGPTPDVPERLKYTVVGRFAIAGTPPVPLKDFVQVNGPAALVPYLREGLSSLTARGPFDTYFLPSLNVWELSKGFDPNQVTAARQAEEDSESWLRPLLGTA